MEILLGVKERSKCDIKGVGLEAFNTTFYLLPLGGCDVVLGAKWLETLGPITWDFPKLTMEFLHHGRTGRIHGLSLHQLSFVKDSRLMFNPICGGKGLMLQISQEEVLTG